MKTFGPKKAFHEFTASRRGKFHKPRISGASFGPKIKMNKGLSGNFMPKVKI
jgi:hypothetical protein